MKKKIDEDLVLYFDNLFPLKRKSKIKQRYTVILGIGGNIGNMRLRFHKLFFSLKQNRDIQILQTSPLLLNPPFGYIAQDNFLNGIIKITTNLSPIKVLDLVQRYENRYKRIRTFQDAPRTLDIDIIFIYQGSKSVKIDTKRLIVPHKGWSNRDSVKIPLQYLK